MLHLTLLIVSLCKFCSLILQGIEIIGKPIMNCFAIKATTEQLHIFVLADEMEKRGVYYT